MSALKSMSNPLLDALKPEIAAFTWDGIGAIEQALGDTTIPIHVHIIGIPINVDVKITSIEGLVEKVITAFVGPKPVATAPTPAPAPPPAPDMDATPSAPAAAAPGPVTDAPLTTAPGTPGTGPVGITWQEAMDRQIAAQQASRDAGNPPDIVADVNSSDNNQVHAVNDAGI